MHKYVCLFAVFTFQLSGYLLKFLVLLRLKVGKNSIHYSSGFSVLKHGSKNNPRICRLLYDISAKERVETPQNTPPWLEIRFYHVFHLTVVTSLGERSKWGSIRAGIYQTCLKTCNNVFFLEKSGRNCVKWEMQCNKQKVGVTHVSLGRVGGKI